MSSNKFGARKTLCSQGHPHPSALEASVCEILVLRQKAGDIRNLKYQHTATLAFGVKWKIDWSFEQSPDWHLRFAEAKGQDTREFKLKLRMWVGGCGAGPLELWRGDHRRPRLDRVYVPDSDMKKENAND